MTTYFVDETAPDGGDGSIENPFNNYEDALSATSPACTCVVYISNAGNNDLKITLGGAHET